MRKSSTSEILVSLILLAWALTRGKGKGKGKGKKRYPSKATKLSNSRGS